MKRAPALRIVDEHGPERVRIRLIALGYQPVTIQSLADTLVLKFAADFADGAGMVGYIDRISWLNHGLPKLAGIDWLSVEESLLPQLAHENDFQLNLESQHAALRQIRPLGWQHSLVPEQSWPVLMAMTGPVSICAVELPDAKARISPESLSILNKKLSLALSFVLGTSSIRLETLRQVNVGDVLLIERAAQYVWTQNKRLFKFELNEEAIMIQAMDEEPEQEFPNTGEPADLNGLPVSLSFVLYEKTVTLGEFSTIGVGEILSLPSNTLLDVEIRANQRCFAKGELIELADGRLGVEIRKIWP